MQLGLHTLVGGDITLEPANHDLSLLWASLWKGGGEIRIGRGVARQFRRVGESQRRGGGGGGGGEVEVEVRNK